MAAAGFVVFYLLRSVLSPVLLIMAVLIVALPVYLLLSAYLSGNRGLLLWVIS